MFTCLKELCRHSTKSNSPSESSFAIAAAYVALPSSSAAAAADVVSSPLLQLVVLAAFPAIHTPVVFGPVLFCFVQTITNNSLLQQKFSLSFRL